jgi:hypothetical protein
MMDQQYQTLLLLRLIAILIIVVGWLGMWRCAQCALKTIGG